MGESYRGKNLGNPFKMGNVVDHSHTVYGFQPQKGVPIAFSVWFAISTVFHIYQNLYPPLERFRQPHQYTLRLTGWLQQIQVMESYLFSSMGSPVVHCRLRCT